MGIFAIREQSHESITEGRGVTLKSGGSWLGIEEERWLVRTEADKWWSLEMESDTLLSLPRNHWMHGQDKDAWMICVR